MTNDTKPEDAIAEGGLLACIQPPVFFDKSGESAPAVAFYPNPAGLTDASGSIIDAHLTLGGLHGVVRLVKADVHQLSEVLLQMLEMTEPMIQPLPPDEVRAALPATQAKAIMASEVRDVYKAFAADPQRVTDLLCDFFKGIGAINGQSEMVQRTSSSVLLGAARRWLDDFMVRHESEHAAFNDMLDHLDRPLANLSFRFTVKDRVRLLTAMPEQGLRGLEAGQVGEVVHVFWAGSEVVEVRFRDEQGNQLAYVTMRHGCLEPAP